MVLFVNEVVLDEVPPDPHSLFAMFPELKETASQFCSIPTKPVEPANLLYIDQREFAVTVPQDKNVSILGSDGATTCIIGVLRHPGSGAVGMAHFDHFAIEDGVMKLVQQVHEQSLGCLDDHLELYLAGGYPDSRCISDQLYDNVMHAFHKQPFNIDVMLMCIDEANCTVRNGMLYPILYGIAVNIKSGEIFPATFPNRGPDLALRQARQFAEDQQMFDIYDTSLGVLRIGPFYYDSTLCDVASEWVQGSDEFILSLCTTPKVEPPYIVSDIRASLKRILEHPFPAVTLFPDGQPHYYRRDDVGSWTRVHL